jgi:hypothetical protein
MNSKKPDDAARITGLTNILKNANQPKEIHAPPALPTAEPVEAPATAVATRSRRERVGKREDPNYHQCGLYIRKTTHKRARRRLEDTQPGKDMSELVQELLEQWLESPR